MCWHWLQQLWESVCWKDSWERSRTTLNLPKIVKAKIVPILSWISSPGQMKGLRHLVARVCDLWAETATMNSGWLLRINASSTYKNYEDATKANTTSLSCRKDCTSHLFRRWQTCHSNLHFCPIQVPAVASSPLIITQCKPRLEVTTVNVGMPQRGGVKHERQSKLLLHLEWNNFYMALSSLGGKCCNWRLK